MADDSSGPSGLSAARGIVAAVVAIAAPVLGAVLYATRTTALPHLSIVDVELDGRSLSTQQLVSLGPAVRGHLLWDLPFIACYGVGLVVGALLLGRVSRSTAGRALARFGVFAAGIAVLADLVEDAGLWLAFRGAPTAASSAGAFDVASAASVTKFSAVLPPALAALAGVVLTITRLLTSLGAKQAGVGDAARFPALPVLPEDPPADGPTAHPPSAGAAELARWRRGYNVPACGHPHAGVHDQPTGICFSGGGIRAASVAMGALQAPEFRQVLPKARYLVSVSGGGYTAGAFQQALTGAGADPTVVPDAATAFMPGTAEEDHVRRHSSYLAANPVELLLALAVLARHLLLTLTLLFGPAVLLGVAAGRFYRVVPVTVLDATAASAAGRGGSPTFPGPRGSAVGALAVLAALAVVAWLVGSLASAHAGARLWTAVRPIATSASRMFARLTLVAALLVVVLPAVVWLSSWLLHHTGGGMQVSGSVAGVLLAYGASVASVAWRNRKLVTDTATGAKVPKTAPRGVVQVGLVALTLVVLGLAWLLLLGSMVTVGLRSLSSGDWIVLGVLAAVVVFLGGFADETTLSLHPFYRGRIATAFAVRRVTRADGTTIARPYRPEERTVLSQYGRLADPEAFPHVIFAASATVGEKRTAPGAARVSYTFCADWTGGPDLGYLSTAAMESLSPPRLQRDLTVQGAVALSGAAIAASVGGQRTSWYETLFVVTGLRLGAWMPNPRYLIDRYTGQRPWHEPGLPHARRLSYLLRQLFGVHSAEAPLVQVTDGGFYDNLGLVELMRRGVTRIYCIDASGDSPPAATTLAQALTLAQQELGVQTDLEQGTWSTFTAGSAEPLAPKSPLATLSARLSQRGVITGTFEYPPGSPFAGSGKGVLVVAKSSLWPGLPYPVLAYAHNQTVFPRDSTGDQFFDDRQYAAYTSLGRALGKAAVEAMDRYDENGEPIVPPVAVPPAIPVQPGAGMA